MKRWPPEPGGLAAKLAELELELIVGALEANDGGIRAAARALKVGPSHLLSRMRRLGIEVEIWAVVRTREGLG